MKDKHIYGMLFLVWEFTLLSLKGAALLNLFSPAPIIVQWVKTSGHQLYISMFVGASGSWPTCIMKTKNFWDSSELTCSYYFIFIDILPPCLVEKSFGTSPETPFPVAQADGCSPVSLDAA